MELLYLGRQVILTESDSIFSGSPKILDGQLVLVHQQLACIKSILWLMKKCDPLPHNISGKFSVAGIQLIRGKRFAFELKIGAHD
jgi:hypothetical protein